MEAVCHTPMAEVMERFGGMLALVCIIAADEDYTYESANTSYNSGTMQAELEGVTCNHHMNKPVDEL